MPLPSAFDGQTGQRRAPCVFADFCIFVNPIKIYGERALRSDGSALFCTIRLLIMILIIIRIFHQ